MLPLVLGLIVGYYIFFSPPIGLADSADFGRIFLQLGLDRSGTTPNDQFFNFFNPEYQINRESKIPVKLTQVFLFVSLIFNKIFYSESHYSIFFLSIIYFILYIGGFYLFLRNLFRTSQLNHLGKYLVAGLSIIVLSDVMFVSYFNSLYQEILFIVFFIYVIAFYLDSTINYNYLLIALIILSVSKTQNFIFLILSFYIMIWKFKKTNKIILVGASFAVLFFRHFLIKEQKQTNKANLYETVFLGLMYCASESEKLKILNDLDLKEANYLENVKEVYWRPGNEIANRKGNLHKEFYSKVSQLDIMITYIYNPQILFKMVIMGIKYLVINPAQPQHLGNYLKKDSKGAKLTLKETFWGKYLNKTFLLIYLFSLASCVYNIATGRRNFRLTLTIILIMLIPLVFTATLVAGGINDFVKHNLSVYFMISILFLLLCSNVLEIIKSQSASQKVALF